MAVYEDRCERDGAFDVRPALSTAPGRRPPVAPLTPARRRLPRRP